jgi:hypothetical protein
MEMTFTKDNSFRINCLGKSVAPQVIFAVDFSRKLLSETGFKGADRFQINLQEDKSLKNGSFKVIWSDEKPKTITIQGDEEGLRCGLYSFLHKLGIEWFNPGEEAVVPQLPVKVDLADFINKTHVPDFIYRGLHICAGKHHFDPAVAKWMSFNLMNRKLTHLPEDNILGEDLRKLGLRPDTTVHSYELMIPDHKYFKSHPEWFAMVGGKRIRQGDGGQLCLSNKEMRNSFAEEVIRYGKSKPHIGLIGICPNDGYGHCECANCRALDTEKDIKENKVNGRVADFVYDVCRIVKKKAPELVLGHYSYSNFANFMELMPDVPDNLVISFTQFHCQKHKISDSACLKNRKNHQRMKNILKTKAQTYIYDYYNHGWDDMPAPMWETVAGDFKDWHNWGIYGFLSEVPGADHAAWKSFWPTYYTAAQMLWNCKQDVQVLESNWCKLRYGKAEKPMLEYFRALRKAFNDMPGCFNKDPEEFKRIFTPEVQRQGAECLKQALKLETRPVYVKRINAEKKLFEEWIINYNERKKYQSNKTVKARPVEELTQLFAENKAIPSDKLFFVSKSSQLPDYENPTRATVFNGKEQLGFKIVLFETKMKTLKIPRPDSGLKIYGADNLEIFIGDGEDSKKCYHFLISADGQCAASECKGSRWNWSWKHNARIKTFRYADRWEIIFLLDKKVVNCSNRNFGFSLVRNRHANGKWTLWGVPGGGSFFNTAKYITAE